MLVSCSKCGRIHERGNCSIKTTRLYKNKGESRADKYRNTSEWKRVRGSIVMRDKYLCQCCIRNIYSYTSRIYDNSLIEVHHIIPINEGWEYRNKGDNLISLCPHHHKMGDRGEISRSQLKQIVKEQIDNNNN